MPFVDTRCVPATTLTAPFVLALLLVPFPAPAQEAPAAQSDVCVRADDAAPPAIDRRVRRALERATQAVRARRYADARAYVDELELDGLPPAELSMVEAMLFRIAETARNYDEARLHAVRAIESCGLTAEEAVRARDAIERIDALLAAKQVAAVVLASPAVAPPKSPAAATTPEALLAEIDEIQAQRGPTSPELIEPLTTLSLLYEKSGDYELALAAIDAATYVVEVNYGLHTLDEARLLAQAVRIERARGNAEGAWNDEQELLSLIQRHPYDVRTVPLLRDIAAVRREILVRYEAGELPPEIILGCYYSEVVYINALRTRTGCGSGSKKKAVRSLRAEAAGYEARAQRLTAVAELPCERPEPPTVESEESSKRRMGEPRALEHLFAVADYAVCMAAKYQLAVLGNASPEELLNQAERRNAAIEELASRAALHEERFGSLPRRIDAVIDSLQRP